MIRNILHTFAALGVAAVLMLNTAQAADAVSSPAGGPQSDARVAQQVYAALNKDPTYYFRHVNVQVQHGVVTLRGYVWSAESIRRAEKIASGVAGVSRVIDQMELERNGTAPHA